MAEREYRRLTRARNRSSFAIAFTARTSLWLGRDHLLQIETSGYTESYKRFHFRDIQAIAFCTTRTWLYFGGLFAALAALFGAIAAGIGTVIGWSIFGSIAGVLALCLIVDLLAGPTAKCYLRTAVQTEPLASITRLRTARKVTGVLQPLITNAQGELKPEALAPETTAQAIPPIISEVPPPVVEPMVPPSAPQNENPP
jgi:hypothetical protein